MTTVAEIRTLLLTRDDAVGRALVALAARQTYDEQQSERTKYRNYKGFRPCHAKRGTSMARYYERFGRLTPAQLAWWRVRTEAGKTRIEIYARQLLIVAEEKAARKAKEATHE